MALTINLKKMIHRKSAEFLATNPAGNTAAGSFIVSDKAGIVPNKELVYYIGGVSAIWHYSPDDDSWQQIISSGALGTFGAGSCGELRSISAPAGVITNTATSGTTTTIVTALTITRNLSGSKIRVIDGSGVGYDGEILSNTIGAASIITVSVESSVAFSSTTKYQIFAGSLWFMNAGTGAVGFSVYDRATNVWTARSVTNIPTPWGTDAQLVSTPGTTSNGNLGFVNSTATSATETTIVDTTKTWIASSFINYQVRIVSGTGSGQIRAITANTTTSLTVATWTVTPDATSVYRIEGNDDYIYLLGNAAVAMYRYSISSNAWTVLAPTAARGAVPGAGMTADWIDGVKDAQWLDEKYTNHYGTSIVRQNGRYIYSFRGAASNVLDVYDIAANKWISAIAYGNQFETFSTGSCSVDNYGKIYIQKDATGRIYYFDVAKNILKPFTFNPVPQGAATGGDKMFIMSYTDGASTLDYLYTLGNTRSELTRLVII